AFAEQEQFGLHPGWFWATLTIMVEIIGPTLLISGRFVWLGAGMLGVFTAPRGPRGISILDDDRRGALRCDQRLLRTRRNDRRLHPGRDHCGARTEERPAIGVAEGYANNAAD
ncbi:MAG TPA: DoxX family protein, partial [Acetobacteraceae bacterium]|nr:DoxX family protein [Acetobacteraceae bacterium]